MTFGSKISKRIFDIFFSLLALTLLSPFFLLFILLIKISYAGKSVPVFFGVELLSRFGIPFKMWKFSTMVPDAHLIIEKMIAENSYMENEWRNNYKLMDDSRILPGIGTFMRKTSINEIPQFYNVLKGDMSVVGPRPISKEEEALFIEFGGADMLRERHERRPGVTGWWQVSGRNDTSYEERVRLDKYYLDHQSILFDLKIICLTLFKLLSRKGAY